MLLSINSFLFILYCIRFTIRCCTIYSGNINNKTDVAIVILLLIIFVTICMNLCKYWHFMVWIMVYVHILCVYLCTWWCSPLQIKFKYCIKNFPHFIYFINTNSYNKANIWNYITCISFPSTVVILHLTAKAFLIGKFHYELLTFFSKYLFFFINWFTCFIIIKMFN